MGVVQGLDCGMHNISVFTTYLKTATYINYSVVVIVDIEHVGCFSRSRWKCDWKRRKKMWL